ncbi:MAG: hypothetical protein AAB531_03090 [Patescibacteria group bacterium]
MWKKIKKKLRVKKYSLIEIIFIIFSFLFSFWLMFSTFSYKAGSMLIASKAWSDFASSIPLIRSFSFGSNFPPQYPLFPGEPIHYHFLFFLLVGLLERIGFRIDYALNFPSAIGFFFLLFMIYIFAKSLFKSKAVGVLSVVFFLFNGSLSFLEFFKIHPISTNIFNEIFVNTTYPSFGPYDGKIVSAFWNLNIYTNQRHLAGSFAMVIFIIYLLYIRWRESAAWFKKSIFIACLCGILLFINEAAFSIALLWIGWFFLLNPRRRLGLLFGIVIGSPIILLFIFIVHLSSSITIRLGYLTMPPATIYSIFIYWFYNFGLLILLLPLGFLIVKKKVAVHIIPLIILFSVANIFQLSKDIINNHKFFNFFIIVGNMYAANFLFVLWNKNKRFVISRKIIVIILFFFMIFSGVIDLAVIKNDSKIGVIDYPKNRDITFILKRTKPEDIVLNYTSLYHPASLAGRSIFYGYSYFAWSYGYDTANREAIYLQIYRSNNKEVACSLLKKNKISYIELNNTPDEYIKPNLDLWENEFTRIYQNEESKFSLYDVKKSC